MARKPLALNLMALFSNISPEFWRILPQVPMLSVPDFVLLDRVKARGLLYSEQQLWRLPSDCAAVCTILVMEGHCPLARRSLAISLSLAAFYDAKNANGKFLGGRGSSLYCAHTASGEENTHTHILSEVKPCRAPHRCLVLTVCRPCRRRRSRPCSRGSRRTRRG